MYLLLAWKNKHTFQQILEQSCEIRRISTHSPHPNVSTATFLVGFRINYKALIHHKKLNMSNKGKVISSPPPSVAYTRPCTRIALVQIMACRLFGAKLLPEQMPTYCQLDP